MREKQRQQQEMIRNRLEEQKKQSEEDSRWLEEEESKSDFPLSPTTVRLPFEILTACLKLKITVMMLGNQLRFCLENYHTYKHPLSRLQTSLVTPTNVSCHTYTAIFSHTYKLSWSHLYKHPWSRL